MELGTEWPGWLRECNNGRHRRVVVQEEGEGVEAFAERVSDHAARMLALGTPLGLCVVACNDRADERALVARRRVGQALSSALARVGGGRVLLTTSRRSSLRVRGKLSAFATDLTEEWQRGGVSSSVRFGPDVTVGQEISEKTPRKRLARRPAKEKHRRVA
jgi:hypothetical protein